MGPSCISASTEKKPKIREKIHIVAEVEPCSERVALQEGEKMEGEAEELMGLTWEKGGLGVSLDVGRYPPFACGHSSCLRHPQGNHSTPGKGENKAGLNQPLPLSRLCLESCVRPFNMKREMAGSARALGSLLASSFLNNILK